MTEMQSNMGPFPQTPMAQTSAVQNRLQMFRNNRTPQANGVRANVNRIISVPPINTRAIGTAAVNQ